LRSINCLTSGLAGAGDTHKPRRGEEADCDGNYQGINLCLAHGKSS